MAIKLSRTRFISTARQSSKRVGTVYIRCFAVRLFALEKCFTEDSIIQFQFVAATAVCVRNTHH